MSAHTKGPCKIERPTPGHIAVKAPSGASLFYEAATDDAVADADLICEAFNVSTETGLTPRQLADQRAELLAFAKEYAEAYENGMAGDGYLLRIARAAIAKATGGAA